MLFQNICGVDLGTDTIKIRDKSGKRFMDTKNMIAIRDKTQVIAIGDAAYEMYEKNPLNVEVSCPMSNGVIASSTNMRRVLSYTLKKFSSFAQTSSDICMAVPGKVTPVERRAFFNVLSGGISASRVRLVDKGLADAVSIGLPVLSPQGHMIVNIGADTTEISVITNGSVILAQTLKLGGRKLDEDICTMVRRKFNINIGRRTAERLKNNLAFMINGPRLEQKVFGIHTLSGLPKSDMVPSLDVSVAIIDTVDQIVQNIKSVYERTPPQIMKDIAEEGIFLTGGVSMLLNLPIYIQKEVGLPIYHIQDPKNSTVRGLVDIINNRELRSLTRSPKVRYR